MPQKTYRLHKKDGVGFISGYAEGKDAILQNIFLLLTTEWGDYEIFPSDYGIKRSDLHGMRANYILSMLKRRVSDAIAHHFGNVVSITGFSSQFDNEKIHTAVHLSYIDNNNK